MFIKKYFLQFSNLFGLIIFSLLLVIFLSVLSAFENDIRITGIIIKQLKSYGIQAAEAQSIIHTTYKNIYKIGNDTGLSQKYAVLFAVRHMSGKIRLLVIVQGQVVKSVAIISHNELYSYKKYFRDRKIMAGHYSTFLGQFQNKSIYDLYSIKEDVIPISGAGYTSQIIADGVKNAVKAYRKMEEDKWRKHL